MTHPSIPASPAPQATILVACLGNEHRGDDAFGLLVARRLGAGTARAKILAHRGDALSLIDAWRGVDHVIIVDAIASPHPPGTILEFDVSTIPAPLETGGTSSHALGPGGAIAMAHALGDLPARVDVLAVAGRDFAVGAGVSPEVAARVDTVVERIHAMVGEFTADRPSKGSTGQVAAPKIVRVR
jgi:hydrogenase maturation protease